MSYDPNEIIGGPAPRDFWRVSPPNVRDEARKILKSQYISKFPRDFFSGYSNLTPQQIEAEYSPLFDETVNREGGIEPRDFRDFSSRLKERLDTNLGALGERLDMGKSDRLDSGKGDRLGFLLGAIHLLSRQAGKTLSGHSSRPCRGARLMAARGDLSNNLQ